MRRLTVVSWLLACSFMSLSLCAADEPKPDQAKPAEAKPADKSAADNKPAESKPADNKPAAPAQPVSFSKQIAPIFVAKCQACHGTSEPKGEYQLDYVTRRRSRPAPAAPPPSRPASPMTASYCG